MQSKAATPQAYLDGLPEDRKAAVGALRKAILKRLPNGFQETMGYGMINYVVPHSLYPAGYHVDPKLPLPFIAIGSQKHFVALYHMGLYGEKQLLDWFTREFAKRSETKLDMGKSCVRFKKPESIPLDLIGELAGKLTVKDWIAAYEKARKR